MTVTSAQPQDAVAAAVEAHLHAARQDPAAFASYVLRDERTGWPIELAPMHCEWHDLFDRHQRLVLWAHIEAAKTSTLVGRVLWALGKQPSTRIGLVSNTATQAEKVLRSVARYIQGSAELQQVFPQLRPGDQWTNAAITIQRPVVSKDPSVQAFGVHGAVLGARLDLLILDDVLDYENCRTADQRQQLAEWYAASCAGRLTEGGRVIVAGVAYHPDDLLHRLSSQPGWSAVRFAVTNDDGHSRWPQRWSAERIEKKRAELGPLEAARQLDCMARSEADARFKEEWIRIALNRGRGKHLVPHLAVLPPRYRTVTGVDLAVSAKSSADLTVFFTIVVHPNGDREVLSIESGRWAGPEIVERIMRTHQRFQSTVVVESNAAQAYIAQMVRKLSAVPVISYTTGRGQSSLEWQCEALATEMANGKWLLPSGDGGVPTGEVAALTRDLLYYDARAHTPDRVAAACFARWGAQQGEQRVTTFNIDLLSLTEMTMNAAAYLRVSSRAQDHATQQSAVERAAAARGDTIVAWYAEKKSGKTLARPELDRLRADARAGHLRRLYVFKLDRFTRSGIRDTFEVIEELRAHGCELVSVADGFGLDGPAAEVVLAVMAWAAKMERLAIGERIAAARERVEATGGRWGRPRRLNEEDFAAAYKLYIRGKTVREIAVALKCPRSTVGRAIRAEEDRHVEAAREKAQRRAARKASRRAA